MLSEDAQQATRNELARQAIKHYEEAATKAGIHNSLIPEALKFWAENGSVAKERDNETKWAKHYCDENIKFRKIIADLTQERDAANKRVEELEEQANARRTAEFFGHVKCLEDELHKSQAQLATLQVVAGEVVEYFNKPKIVASTLDVFEVVYPLKPLLDRLASLLDGENKVVMVENPIVSHGLDINGDATEITLILSRSNGADIEAINAITAHDKTFLVAIMGVRK